MWYKIMAKLETTYERLRWGNNDYEPPTEYSYGDIITGLTMYPIGIFFAWIKNQLDKTAVKKQ